MLNYCIQRKREHHKQSSKPVSTSSSSASVKANSDSFSSMNYLESPDSPKEPKWDVDTVESDSEDEFFEAVEEQQRVSQNCRDEVMDTTSPRGSITESHSQCGSPSGSFMSLNRPANDAELERTGVLKETDIVLLETNEPLCIPITQVCNCILTIFCMSFGSHLFVILWIGLQYFFCINIIASRFQCKNVQTVGSFSVDHETINLSYSLLVC